MALSDSWASTPGVRRRMQRQGSSNTGPEVALRRELHRRGLRYRLHAAVVPGKLRRRVDIVFPRARVAVFVDGCFWHGCESHSKPSNTNASYWTPKIEGNRLRDADTTRLLEAAGWCVIRLWEHEAVEDAADRVERAVRSVG
jgi:DNA mismatch endonuclease (patch repair protein)